VCLLLFGGSTLQDFAFALTVGLISGAYSSVAVASPLYALWKEREPRFQALKKRFATAK
jgi:SecD/SecF fusion protein